MSVTRFTYIRILSRLRRLIRNDHLILVILAIVAGTAAGAAVIGFRETISFIQLALYGSDSEHLFTNTEAVAWWQILLAPVAGGLVVGVLVRYLMPEGRTQGVADVIEASALKDSARRYPNKRGRKPRRVPRRNRRISLEQMHTGTAHQFRTRADHR